MRREIGEETSKKALKFYKFHTDDTKYFRRNKTKEAINRTSRDRLIEYK